MGGGAGKVLVGTVVGDGSGEGGLHGVVADGPERHPCGGVGRGHGLGGKDGRDNAALEGVDNVADSADVGRAVLRSAVEERILARVVVHHGHVVDVGAAAQERVPQAVHVEVVVVADAPRDRHGRGAGHSHAVVEDGHEVGLVDLVVVVGGTRGDQMPVGQGVRLNVEVEAVDPLGGVGRALVERDEGITLGHGGLCIGSGFDPAGDAVEELNRDAGCVGLDEERAHDRRAVYDVCDVHVEVNAVVSRKLAPGVDEVADQVVLEGGVAKKETSAMGKKKKKMTYSATLQLALYCDAG